MKSSSVDFLEMLRILANHNVDFIVVGGVGAVLHGAPVTTFDLDVVHARDPANIGKTLAALIDLEASSHLHQKNIPINESHLSGTGHLLLKTRHGRLDLLGSIGDGQTYESLVNHSVPVRIQDVSFRILDLESLIRIKRETGRPKDLATLGLLRATLKERQSRLKSAEDEEAG